MFELSDILSYVPENNRQLLIDLFENAPVYIAERSSIKTIQPGQTLISADLKADKIFIHLTGKLLGVDTFEPDIIYNFIELYPVNIIGEFEAFSNKQNYQINISAKSKSMLLAIATQDFLNWMQCDIKALNIITRLLTNKFSSESKMNRGYLFLNSYDRLLIYLYNHCIHLNPDDKIITLNKKHSELAEEVGFCEKTINRAVDKLVRNGLITSGRNAIKISPKQFHLIKETLDERQLI